MLHLYTITFESNGGSIVESITSDFGVAVTEPTAPTLEGHIFDGWYIDEDLTILYVFDTMGSVDITLYAKWIEETT